MSSQNVAVCVLNFQRNSQYNKSKTYEKRALFFAEQKDERCIRKKINPIPHKHPTEICAEHVLRAQ